MPQSTPRNAWCLAALAACLLSTPAMAQPSPAKPLSAAAAGAPGTYTADGWTDAEVRRLDPVNNRITLRHGEIKNLGMPPMTMVFSVRDPGLLEDVRVGEKVRVLVEDEGGGKLVIYGLKPGN